MNSNRLQTARKTVARATMVERQLRRYQPRFQRTVRALAFRHSRIEDLAASFPALLFALAVPRSGLDPEPALTRVIEGLSLAEVAMAADLPMWLRRLPPEAFIRRLTRLPDGDLFRRQIANHLPESPKLASTWLYAVGEVAELAHEPAAIWIARELVREPGRVKPARLKLISLWSWFSVHPATLGHDLIDRPWTPRMRIGQALAAADDWRTNVDLHVNLGARRKFDMWLQEGHVAGYDFIPLDSTRSIVDEARAMRNCLRTYGYNLAHNRSRLWSVRKDGRRISTLRIGAQGGDPLPIIIELEGAGNTAAKRDLWWAARQWLHMHDLSQVDMRQRNWRTAPLDRATWLSLWRPYWLAKRRIPEWLPLAPSRDALRAL